MAWLAGGGLMPSPGRPRRLLAVFRGRKVVDRLGWTYAALVSVQGATVAFYEVGLLPPVLGLAVGLSTSLLGPVFSLAVSLHIFGHRQASRGWEVAAVALTYAVTCTSFAILDVIISDGFSAAFSQPPGSPGKLSFGVALYFSLVTITTTGYGDIVPLSGLARASASGEIIIGLSYQVSVFSLLAALLSSGQQDTKD